MRAVVSELQPHMASGSTREWTGQSSSVVTRSGSHAPGAGRWLHVGMDARRMRGPRAALAAGRVSGRVDEERAPNRGSSVLLIWTLAVDVAITRQSEVWAWTSAPGGARVGCKQAECMCCM